MKLKVFIFIIITVTAGSYIFSNKIYRFYTKIYYTHVKKIKYDKMIDEAKTLFKNKKYRLLNDRLNLMETLYSESLEVKRIKGLNYIKLGREIDGAYLIVSTLDEDRINPDLLAEAIGIFFKNELYGEIVNIYRNHKYLNNRKLLFYYGVSFYKKGDYMSALKMLNRINGYEGINFSDYDKSILFFYMGASYEKMEMLQKALIYIKYAWNLDYRNSMIRKALVRIYRKLKKYEEAERILRLK